MRPAAVLALRLLLLGALLAAASVGAACGAFRGPPAPRVQLSPDSLEVLERALLRVRPAYATQRAALRAGVYETEAPAQEERDEVVPDERPPAAPDPAAAEDRGWVVQVAAYPGLDEARRTAEALGRRYPRWRVRVERGPGVYRVALGAWGDAVEAEAALREIRRSHPDAWLRRAGEEVR